MPAPKWVQWVLTAIVFTVLGLVTVVVVLALTRDKPYDLTPQQPKRELTYLSPSPAETP